MSEKTLTTVRIDRSLWRRVKDMAYEKNVKVGEALEELLKKALEGVE